MTDLANENMKFFRNRIKWLWKAYLSVCIIMLNLWRCNLYMVQINTWMQFHCDVQFRSLCKLWVVDGRMGTFARCGFGAFVFWLA